MIRHIHWLALLGLFAFSSVQAVEENAPSLKKSEVPAKHQSKEGDVEKASNTKARTVKEASFFPSLGLSFLSYKEVGISPVSMFSLSARINYVYRFFPPNWELDVGLFGDLLPLRKTGTDITARSLGGSARVGLTFPGSHSPWRLKLLGGWEYSRMWVTGNAYGYNNMLRAQLYPVLEREFGNNIVRAFFKLNPIMNGATFVPLSNNELGVGLGWTRSLGNGHPLTINFDYNRLKINYQSVHVGAETFAVFAGYGF